MCVIVVVKEIKQPFSSYTLSYLKKTALNPLTKTGLKVSLQARLNKVIGALYFFQPSMRITMQILFIVQQVFLHIGRNNHAFYIKFHDEVFIL